MRPSTKPSLLQNAKKDIVWCKRLTHTLGPNFSVGFRMLPFEKRRAIYASYACCRLIDDLADKKKKPSLELLSKWVEEIEKAYKGNPSYPATRELFLALTKFPIPKKGFLDLIEGCKLDFLKKRYYSFEELLSYSELVASSISNISLSIFGYKDKEAYIYGRRLATAFQLTNVIRDVKEDLEKGRIYLPLNEAKEFGLKEEDFFKNPFIKNMENFLKFQCKRTIVFFNLSKPLFSLISKDSQLCVKLMHGIYFKIIKKIEKNPLNVFKKRVKLNIFEKLSLVLNLSLKSFYPKKLV